MQGQKGMKWNVRSWSAGTTYRSATPKTPDNERLMARFDGEAQSLMSTGLGAAGGISVVFNSGFSNNTSWR